MTTVSGIGPMVRLNLRRDWVFWGLWIIGLAIMMPLTAGQYDAIIPPGTDPRATLEPLRNNPTMLALLGPAFDIYTKGGFVFWRVGGFVSMFAGMMAGFGIIRATRAEEEDGRHELMRSGIMGRHAPLAAGVLMAALGSLVAGLASGGLVIAAGLPTSGGMAAALAIAGTGLVFTGIGAVCAQVFESARSARGWTLGVFFGGMFLARMMVDGAGPDASYGWLRWLIPMEWGMLMRPWSDERWWVFALPVALTLALVLLAFRLESLRDHGAGLRQTRPGRADAASYLAGPVGLSLRLQRGGVIGWTIGLLVAAVGTGSIMNQMDESLAANPELGAMLEKLGGSDVMVVAFYLSMLVILGTAISVLAAQLVLRLRSEESRGHAEVILATATSRWRYAGTQVAWAVGLPVLLFVAVGALLPLTQASATGDYSTVAEYARGAAALSPGIVLIVGVAMALVGWLPRASGLVWALVGWSFFATWVGVLFDIPEEVLKVNPWGYLSHLPRDEMDWVPFAIELANGLGLIVIGLVGYRRRNIPS